jgi:hypothetical protein
MDSLSTHLKKLTPVKIGDSIDEAITADRINAIQSSVLMIAKGDNIQTAGGVTKTSSGSSVVIQGPGAPDKYKPLHEPFEVTISGTPESFRAGYPPGVYILCHLGYVSNLVDGAIVRPVATVYNGVTYAYDDIQDEDYGWFISHSYGASDKYVWLGYVTDVNGVLVTTTTATPGYAYSHTSPGIWFTDSATAPIVRGAHAGAGYSSDRYRFILIAKVVSDTTEPSGFKITQYRKGNVLIDYEIATPAGPPPWLNPWQCYIASSIEGTSVTLKVNPISTLMQTYSARVDVGTNRWTSKQTVSNFPDNAGNGFVLSDPTHIVYMECSFDSSWKLSSAEVKSGAPWTDGLGKFYNPQNMYVGHGTPASQKWYQLLAWLKPWVDGDPKDVKLGSTWYRLMCPTTTHLVEGFIEGARLGGSTDVQWVGLLPWYGCWSPGGS